MSFSPGLTATQTKKSMSEYSDHQLAELQEELVEASSAAHYFTDCWAPVEAASANGCVIGVKKLDRDRLRNIHSTAIRVANAVEKTADKENWSLDGEG